ncbi:MAG TPA: hypothetical protein VMR95_01565 [Candidatus Binatia bacterium]|nr:hypothetical protein [Candidatus Binatia bacterium]
MRQLSEFLDAGGTFHTRNTDELKRSQQMDILKVMAESVQADYPDRTYDEYEYYMQHAVAVLDNPERASAKDNPFLRPNQSFRNRRVVTANDEEDKLVAVLFGDDNTHSKTSGNLGRVERGIKRFVGAKAYHYTRLVHWRIGQRAVNPKLYEFAGFGSFEPDELTIVDALGLLVLEQASAGQEDTRVYLHAGEREWGLTLDSWGMKPIVDLKTGKSETDKFVFGEPPIEPVKQTAMKGISVDNTIQNINLKSGSHRALARAHDRLTIHE